MKTREDISTGGVTLFSHNAKGGKRNIRKEILEEWRKGDYPKERYPFPFMSKGERNMRREWSRASITGGVWVLPSISKGGIFWIVGCNWCQHKWFSLMSIYVMGEIEESTRSPEGVVMKPEVIWGKRTWSIV